MKLFSAILLALAVIVPHSEACRRMTAAIRYQGKPYLFFGNEMVILDHHYVQEGGMRNVGDSGKWRNVAYPEAAVVFSYDGNEYFFSGGDYFSFWTHWEGRSASYLGGSFFSYGIDAAGNLDHTTIFIKGCDYVKLTPLASDPMPLPKGVPCRPDAALTEGENLLVFKDDLLWEVTPKGVKQPVLTNDRFKLHFDLCKMGEREF